MSVVTGPPLEATKRLGRVLRMVQLIASSPKAWNRRRLALEFELSTRQIDKDLGMIRRALRYELRRSSAGYYFESGLLLRPMHLDESGALALSLAAQHGRDTGSVDPPTVASALSKVEQALPPHLVRILRRAGQLSKGAVPHRAPRRAAKRYERSREAPARGQATRSSYASAAHGGRIIARNLEPCHLLPYRQSWMLVARDSGGGEARMFNVDRFRSLTVASGTYTIADEFDLDSYLGDTWGTLRGSGGAPHHVALPFEAEAAQWVGEHARHRSQVASELDEGVGRVESQCAVTVEPARRLLGYAARVWIEEQAAPREVVVDEATVVVVALSGRGGDSASGPRRRRCGSRRAVSGR